MLFPGHLVIRRSSEITTAKDDATTELGIVIDYILIKRGHSIIEIFQGRIYSIMLF